MFSIRAPRRLLLTLALAIATTGLAALLAGCGGGGTKSVKAETWVDSVCTRFVKWNAKADEQGSKLAAIDMGEPVTAKKEFAKVLSETRTVLSSLRSEFETLGKPDLKSGDSVRSAFLANFDDADKKLADAIKKINALDVKSKNFEGDVQAVFEAIPDSKFRQTMDKIAEKQDDANKVIDLIDEDSECSTAIFSDDSSDSGSAKATPVPTKSSAKSTPTKSAGNSSGHTTAKSNASKNEKWVIGVCVAIATWGEDVGVLADSLSIPSNATAQQMKDAMVTYFQKAVDLTKKLQKSIDALGNPDVKDGKAIQKEFSQLGANLVKSFDATLTKVKAMSTKSVSQVQSDISAFSDEFNTALDEPGVGAEDIDQKYDTTELSKIGDSVPECAGVL